jgi:hypothetical protein
MKKYTTEELRKSFSIKHESNNFNNDNIKAIIVGIVAGVACIGLGVLLGNFIQNIF